MSIAIVSWRDGHLQQSSNVDELPKLIAGRGSRTWIDLANPSPELLQAVARRLGLHPLIAEEIAEQNQRARIRLVGAVIHVVSFILERDTDVTTREVDFVLGTSFLLTVHDGGWDPRAVHQLRMGLAPALERGADFVLWALVDSIVDGYFPVFDHLGDEIDDVQDLALARPTPEALQRVFRLKRELIRIRHVLAPSREVFSQLTSRELAQISDANVFYFRDVYDHLIRLNDELDSFRELATGALDVYLSSVNNNLSTIMKRLTGVTVILAGIGAVGGLFGMSEAGLAFSGAEAAGFWLVVVATIILAVIAAFVLRRINWI